MNSKYQIIKKQEDIILEPTKAAVQSSLVFLHGLGDSAYGWYDLFIKENIVPESTRVVLLTAPVAPVSVNGGMAMTSWFDLFLPHMNKSKYSIDEVVKNQARVIEALNQEIKFHQDDASRVFLGGFSQGAAMSLHIGLEHKRKLGGVIALSGFLFEETKINQLDLNLLITHGDYDDMIPHKEAEVSYKRILGLKNVKHHLVKGLEHSIDNSVMTLMRKFFQALV